MITENIVAGLIAAVVSVILGVTTAAGAKRRDKIEAVKIASDLDLKLAEREDKLRDRLWADVERKIESQDAEIRELQTIVSQQAVQIATLHAENNSLRETVRNQAVQIDKLLAENTNLKNGKGNKSVF